MATLQHYFNGQIQKEYVISSSTTIGRNESNDVAIDNLGVSSFHAKIINENGAYFLEDLESTNGTYVDGHKVIMHILENNQIITLGKHYLKFIEHKKTQKESALIEDENANSTMLAEPTNNMNEVVRAFKKEDAPSDSAFIMTQDNNSIPLSGAFIVGKGKESNIVLDGWFAPNVSLIIDQKMDGYYITSMDSKVKVNGKKVKNLQKLNSRDMISVRGTQFQIYFSYRR